MTTGLFCANSLTALRSESNLQDYSGNFAAVRNAYAQWLGWLDFSCSERIVDFLSLISEVFSASSGVLATGLAIAEIIRRWRRAKRRKQKTE